MTSTKPTTITHIHFRRRAIRSLALALFVLMASFAIVLPSAQAGTWSRTYTGYWYGDGGWEFNASIIYYGGVCWEHGEASARQIAARKTGLHYSLTHTAVIKERRSNYSFQLGVGIGPFSTCGGPTYNGSDNLGRSEVYSAYTVNRYSTSYSTFRDTCHDYHYWLYNNYWRVIGAECNSTSDDLYRI